MATNQSEKGVFAFLRHLMPRKEQKARDPRLVLLERNIDALFAATGGDAGPIMLDDRKFVDQFPQFKLTWQVQPREIRTVTARIGHERDPQTLKTDPNRVLFSLTASICTDRFHYDYTTERITEDVHYQGSNKTTPGFTKASNGAAGQAVLLDACNKYMRIVLEAAG